MTYDAPFMGDASLRPRVSQRVPEHVIADISYAGDVVRCSCGWLGNARQTRGRETPYNVHAGHIERDVFRQTIMPEEPSRQEGIDTGYTVLWKIITGKIDLDGMEQD